MRHTLVSAVGVISASAANAAPLEPPTFYGITLLQPLSIAECGTFQDVAAYRKKFRRFGSAIYPYARPTSGSCYWRADRSKAGTAAPLAFENVDIQFATANAPAFAYGIRALVIDGRVQAVQWTTPGLARQEAILAQLTSKLGAATKTELVTKQNGFGAKYESVVASWSLPQTLTAVFQGSLDRVDRGSVAIMSEVARARVIEDVSKADTSTPM